MIRGINTDKSGHVTLDGNRVIGSFHDNSGLRYYSLLGTDINDNPVDSYGHSIGATHLIECSGDISWGCRYAKVLKTRVHVAVDEDEDGTIWQTWAIKGNRTFSH